MNKQQPTRQEHQLREKTLYRYMDAFERGDFESMSHILEQAEQDPELEQMIWEVQTTYLIEQEVERQENDAELVRQILHKHLPSGWVTPQEVEEIPPLTVSDVIARMQADEAVKGSLKHELNTVVQQLQQSTVPLPRNLGLQGIRTLFAQFGLEASRHLQKLFSETALFLSAGRAQGIAQLAATRRQREHLHLSEKPQKEHGEEKQK